MPFSLRKMTQLLIVTALPQELDHAPLGQDMPVVFTGIGKLNAALTLMDAIDKHRPNLVINYGTAGRISRSISGLVEVADVLQRDMNAAPLAPRGTTPFDDTPWALPSGFAGVRCASGDSFLQASEPWLHEQGVDIVDMELFALALTCRRKHIAWRSFKYITDDTDENAGEDWSEKMHHGRDLFIQKLQELTGK